MDNDTNGIIIANVNQQQRQTIAYDVLGVLHDLRCNDDGQRIDAHALWTEKFR